MLHLLVEYRFLCQLLQKAIVEENASQALVLAEDIRDCKSEIIKAYIESN